MNIQTMTHLKLNLLLGASLAMVVLSINALALPPGGKPPSAEKVIEKLDEDGDSLVSFDEFQSAPQGRGANRLMKADADGDGNVSREEMEAALSEHQNRDADRATGRFDEADVNADGFVTAGEVKQVMFQRIDANEDGYLSADEFSQAHEAQRGRRSERGSGERPSRGDRSETTDGSW